MTIDADWQGKGLGRLGNSFDDDRFFLALTTRKMSSGSNANHELSGSREFGFSNGAGEISLIANGSSKASCAVQTAWQYATGARSSLVCAATDLKPSVCLLWGN
ncbi:hypothetical protein MnTg02_01722 [bacterium MnTg02]|nr:hypothetical protein MnTg02_01722 [bacterium MnTg02]